MFNNNIFSFSNTYTWNECRSDYVFWVIIMAPFSLLRLLNLGIERRLGRKKRKGDTALLSDPEPWQVMKMGGFDINPAERSFTLAQKVEVCRVKG